MRMCNFCSFKFSKQWHKEKGERCLLGPVDSDGFIQVFSFPKSVSKKEAFANPKKYVHAWYMAIGDKCEC